MHRVTEAEVIDALSMLGDEEVQAYRPPSPKNEGLSRRAQSTAGDRPHDVTPPRRKDGVLRGVRQQSSVRVRRCYRVSKAGRPFTICHTAGAERKLPVPAALVMAPAVPRNSVIRRMYVSASCPLSKASTSIRYES